MKKEIKFEAFSTLEELMEKRTRFGEVIAIHELTCGAFTVTYALGVQAMASAHRMQNLLHFLGIDVVNKIDLRYRQADLIDYV